MKIGVIVAMDKEFVQLEKVVQTIQRHEVVLQKCGIGKVNAAIGAMQMIEAHRPGLIVSSGCAGGADTAIQVTDVVVGTEYAYHDVYCGTNCAYGQLLGMPARFQAPGELVGKALALTAHSSPSDSSFSFPRIHAGLMVSGDWFVDSQEKMQAIMEKFPEAKAVDMESCAIAQTCHRMQVPFISFRVISDNPLVDNKASQYFDFWERIADTSFHVTRNFLESL